MRSRPTSLALMAAMSSALLAVACGGDDGATTASTTSTASGSTQTSTGSSGGSDHRGDVDDVDPCGNGATDPADLASDRPIARCAPGTPAPEPLAERTTLVVSSQFSAEFLAPLFLADRFGEFDKENLDIEIVTLPFPDAIPQLVNGEVDVAVGATDSALMNAADQGLGVKWGMGNFFPPAAGDTSVPQTGLWVRRDVFGDPESPDVGELAGKRIASAIGIANATSYFIDKAVETGGIDVTDLQFEVIDSPEMVTAMENGAVDMAWLLDPYWIEAAESPDEYVLVGTQTPGEPIGGFYFGPSAFGADRDQSEAFVRAIIRTINTYLDGDYQSHPNVMQALAEETGQPVESIEATPPLVFDWEIRAGTASGIQELLLGVETLGYADPLQETELVDRSLYEAVIAGA